MARAPIGHGALLFPRAQRWAFGLPILFLLAAIPAFPAGALSGWSAPTPSGTVDLSAEGDQDWAAWIWSQGQVQMQRKAGGGAIADWKITGDAPAAEPHSMGQRFTWKGGTPSAQPPANAGQAFRLVQPGDACGFSVPADTSWRTLRVYVGVRGGYGRLAARLSDGSAPDFAGEAFFGDTLSGATGIYALAYRAASPGQRLQVTWTVRGWHWDAATARLHAATLASGAPRARGAAWPAPLKVAGLPGPGRAIVQWNRVPGALAYDLYRAPAGGDFGASPYLRGWMPSVNDITPPSAHFLVTFADTGLAPGSAYAYRVASASGDTAGPLSAAASVTVGAPQAKVLRLLPLGNSITAGVPGQGGYRYFLEDTLAAAGYTARFLGARDDQSGAMAQPYHEGWSGRTIRDIRDAVVPRALGDFDPDIVLLEIGTNDFAWTPVTTDSVSKALRGYDSLLAAIFARRPEVLLLAAPIPPLLDKNGYVGLFNGGAQATVARYQAAGRRAFWVPELGHFTLDQLVDNVHPTQATYALMAGAWARAIRQALAGTGLRGAPGQSRAGYRHRRGTGGRRDARGQWRSGGGGAATPAFGPGP